MSDRAAGYLVIALTVAIVAAALVVVIIILGLLGMIDFPGGPYVVRVR